MSRRSHSRKRSGCWTILLLFLIPFCLIIAGLGFAGWRVYNAGTSLQANQEKLNGMLDSAESIADLDPVQLDGIIREVREDIVVINATTKPFLPLTPYFSRLPKIGPLMVDAQNYLELADAGTNIASTLRPTIQTVLLTGRQDRTITDNQFAYLITLIADAQPNLASIKGDVNRIQTTYAQLENKEALPWAVRQYIPLLDEFIPYSEAGLAIAQIVPDLFEGDKLYHIWVQNNDELRATGGFISGIIVLRLNDGDIVEFEFQSSADINGNILDYYDQLAYPPAPMVEFMGLEAWVTQDANFYPDFPTSAVQGSQIYAIQKPDEPAVDGVIAIDQIFVAKLLTAIGPTYVPELDIEIGGENITQIMRESFNNPAGLEEGENRLAARRDFIGQMAEALQDRLTADASSIDIFALGRMGLDAIEARNLQIYLRNDKAAQAMSDLGWDGGLDIRPNQDTLAVIDTNFGYNKVNAILDRITRYDVILSAVGEHQARLALSYHHPGDRPDDYICEQIVEYSSTTVYEDLLNRCFYNYVRIYPALGSLLTLASETPVSAEAMLTQTAHDGIVRLINDPLDQPGFSNFLVVPQGNDLTVNFDLQLPPSVIQPIPDGYEYRLVVRKQAGARPQDTTVKVMIPDGATLISTSPELISQDGQTVQFQLLVNYDQEVIVRYTTP